MSKKKLSRIVGLTIGAAAIAGTGVASSVALSSCTGSTDDKNQTQPASKPESTLNGDKTNSNDNVSAQANATKIQLSSKQLRTVFHTISSQLTNNGRTSNHLSYKNINDEYLNSNGKNGYQNKIKAAIVKSIPESKLTVDDIKSVNYAVPQRSSTTFNTRVQIGVTFAENVQLPDLGHSRDYKLDKSKGIDPNTVNQLNDVPVHNNSAKQLKAYKSLDIYNAVQGVVGNLNAKNYNLETLNNATWLQNSLKNEIANKLSSYDILPEDIDSVSFNLGGSRESTELNPLLDVNFAVNFGDNVELVGWDENGHFAPNGQSLQAKTTFEVTNPDYRAVSLNGSTANSIYSAIQSKLTQLTTAQEQQQSYLNNEFQTIAKQAILDTGVDLQMNDINKINFSVAGQGSASPELSISFTIIFAGNVQLINWNNNSIFNADAQHRSITTKDSKAVKVTNLAFNKVQVNAIGAANVYNAIKSLLPTTADELTDTYLNTDGDFQTSVKNKIATTFGGGLKPEYISSVDFNTTVNTQNHSIMDIGFNISFSENVALTGNWNAQNVFSVFGNTISSKKPIQVNNPTFTKTVLNADDAEPIYSKIKALIPTETDLLNSSYLNSGTYQNNIKDAIIEAVPELTYFDIPNIYFTTTVNSNDNTQMFINYTINFGANVTITGGDWNSLYNANAVMNNISTTTPIVVANPMASSQPSIGTYHAGKIADMVIDALYKVNPTQLETLNENIIYKDGLKQAIVNQLAVNNFTPDCIQSVEFVTSIDGNTNYITLIPKVTFSDKVDISTLTDGRKFTFAERTITIDPVVRKLPGAFLSKDNANKLKQFVIDELNAVYNANPNNLTQSYLNSTKVTNDIMNAINNPTGGLVGSNINEGNFSIQFTVGNNGKDCTAPVSYTISFTDTKFANNLSEVEGFNTTKGTISQSNALDGKTLIVTNTMLQNIYNTIKINIPTDTPQINLENLNNKIGPLTVSALNGDLKAPQDNPLIEKITFQIEPNTNKVTANVTFNRGAYIDGNINVANVTSTGIASQYAMSYTVLNLNKYVTTNDINNLDSTVGAWIRAQSMQTIADQQLNANLGDLILKLQKAGFNTSWLDLDKTEFSINFGTTNNIVFKTKLIPDINDSTVANGQGYNPKDHTFTKTYSASANLSFVITQERFDAIRDITNAKIDATYNQMFDGGNGNIKYLADSLNQTGSNEFGNDRYLISDEIYKQVMDETGLNTLAYSSNMSPIHFMTTPDYANNEVTIAYEYGARSPDFINGLNQGVYYVPTNLNMGDDFTKSMRVNDGVGETIFKQTLAPKAANHTSLVTGSALNKLVTTTQQIFKPIYESTLFSGNETKLSEATFKENTQTLQDTFMKAAGLAAGDIIGFSIGDNLTDINSGNISFKIQVNPNSVRFENIADNPYFSVNAHDGTITSKMPIECGTGLFTFDGSTITGLTKKGQAMGTLVFSSYAIDSMSPGILMDSHAAILDFRDVHFINEAMPRILQSEGYNPNFHNLELSTVYLPSTIKTIPNNLFASCPNLSTIENLFGNKNIMTFPSGMIKNCPKITSISFGNYNTTIDKDAYTDCPGIQTIDMSRMDANDSTVANLIKSTSSPSHNPTKIILPKSFTFYDSNVSGTNSNLRNTFENLTQPFDLICGENTYVKPGLFKGTNVRSIDVHNVCVQGGCNTPLIGCSAFENCKYLETFHFNYDGVSLIVDDYAFKNCGRLKTFDGFTKSSKLKAVGTEAFCGCNLSNVVFPETLLQIFDRAFYGTRIVAGTDRLTLGKVQPNANGQGNDMQMIGWNAFAGCTIVNPDGVTPIVYDVVDIHIFDKALNNSCWEKFDGYCTLKDSGTWWKWYYNTPECRRCCRNTYGICPYDNSALIRDWYNTNDSKHRPVHETYWVWMALGWKNSFIYHWW